MNLGFITALSNNMDRDKLPDGVSTVLEKEFEVSLRKVKRRFADCKKECAI